MKRAASSAAKRATVGRAAARPSMVKRSAPKSSRKQAAPKAHKTGGAAGRRQVVPVPAGYRSSGNGSRLVVPVEHTQVVPAGKLKRGLAEAKRQLDETLDEILGTLAGPYEIKEIKLTASFNADGKFLGFGVGGAMSLEITICPCESS